MAEKAAAKKMVPFGDHDHNTESDVKKLLDGKSYIKSEEEIEGASSEPIKEEQNEIEFPCFVLKPEHGDGDEFHQMESLARERIMERWFNEHMVEVETSSSSSSSGYGWQLETDHDVFEELPLDTFHDTEEEKWLRERMIFFSEEKERSDIRKLGDEKHLNILSKTLNCSDFLSIESDQLYMLFKGLTVEDMEELQNGIKMHLDMDRATPIHIEYWEALLMVCSGELAEAKKKEEFLFDKSKIRSETRLFKSHLKPINILVNHLNGSQEMDIESNGPYLLFKGLTIKEMEELCAEIKMHLDADRKKRTRIENQEVLLTVCNWVLAAARKKNPLDLARVEQSLDDEGMSDRFDPPEKLRRDEGRATELNDFVKYLVGFQEQTPYIQRVMNVDLRDEYDYGVVNDDEIIIYESFKVDGEFKIEERGRLRRRDLMGFQDLAHKIYMTFCRVNNIPYEEIYENIGFPWPQRCVSYVNHRGNISILLQPWGLFRTELSFISVWGQEHVGGNVRRQIATRVRGDQWLNVGLMITLDVTSLALFFRALQFHLAAMTGQEVGDVYCSLDRWRGTRFSFHGRENGENVEIIPPQLVWKLAPDGSGPFWLMGDDDEGDLNNFIRRVDHIQVFGV